MRRNYRNILILKEKYNNNGWYLVNLLFFSILKHGKKFLAIKLYFTILFLLKKRYKNILSYESFFKIIHKLLYSKIFLKIQHVGPVPYIIPIISFRKSIFLSKNWLLGGVGDRSERTFILKFFSELIDIKKKCGFSFSKKKNYYKQALKFRSNFRFLRFMKIKKTNLKLNYKKRVKFSYFQFNKNKYFLKKNRVGKKKYWRNTNVNIFKKKQDI